MFTSGTWFLYSKTNPEWDCNGRSNCVGGFAMPKECSEKLEELKTKLGKPPDDLEFGYVKD